MTGTDSRIQIDKVIHLLAISFYAWQFHHLPFIFLIRYMHLRVKKKCNRSIHGFWICTVTFFIPHPQSTQ